MLQFLIQAVAGHHHDGRCMHTRGCECQGASGLDPEYPRVTSSTWHVRAIMHFDQNVSCLPWYTSEILMHWHAQTWSAMELQVGRPNSAL